MSYFGSLQQNVTLPPALQSTDNIDSGVTSTIGSASTLGVNSAQLNVYADEPLMIYLYQSSDDTNWYLSAFWHVEESLAFNTTFQVTNAYVQVRIKNVGVMATSTLVLTTALCPIGIPLPSALSPEGNLKCAVYEIESPEIGRRAIVTPMNHLLVAPSYRLVGTALFSTSLDSRFWSTSVTGSGTVVPANGETTLSTGTTFSSTAQLQSIRAARYVGGSSNRYCAVVKCPVATGANIRRWGAYDSLNGAFFEYDNTGSFSIGTRRNAVDTLVTSGSFNGVYGSRHVDDNYVHTYEIIWTNTKVWFYIDGELLHVADSPTDPWTNSLHLKITAENNNGANTSNNTLHLRVATISRLGELESQPQSLNITTTGTFVAKSSTGNLRAININNFPTTAGTCAIYDGVPGGGGILLGTLNYQRNASSSNLPTSIPYFNMPFSTNLTLVLTGGTTDLTVIFE